MTFLFFISTLIKKPYNYTFPLQGLFHRDTTIPFIFKVHDTIITIRKFVHQAINSKSSQPLCNRAIIWSHRNHVISRVWNIGDSLCKETIITDAFVGVHDWPTSADVSAEISPPPSESISLLPKAEAVYLHNNWCQLPCLLQGL